jgi:signal transduction histidine kinase
MLSVVPQLRFVGELGGDVDWSGQAALLMGMIAIGLLLWQLYRAKRQFAIDLADQAKETETARSRAAAVWLEREKLARENQAKSEMLSTLSREIRANLNGIVGSADLMLDHTLSTAQREHLTTMRSAAESLQQSLNDVMDYAGIETGEIKIASAPFDVRQPLIEVVEHIAPLASLKGLELVMIVAPDVPLSVAGDAIRLRQVLLNLVANAVRYTPSGRVVLRAELSNGPEGIAKAGATWLHFGVTDTGAGIPKEMLATIFNRIATNEAVSERALGGSGLALPICQRFVELMGGQIGARGLPDGGTEFWVLLPLLAAPDQPAPPAPGADSPMWWCSATCRLLGSASPPCSRGSAWTTTRPRRSPRRPVYCGMPWPPAAGNSCCCSMNPW